jgi:hypothetical protein
MRFHEDVYPGREFSSLVSGVAILIIIIIIIIIIPTTNQTL